MTNIFFLFLKESPQVKGEKASVEEDRRNPAYIPKHGLFYEHDDRLESGDEAEAEDLEKPDPEKEGAGDLVLIMPPSPLLIS